MICKECKNWVVEFDACMLGPYEIEDESCWRKNLLAVLLNLATEEEDNWKV